MEKILQLRKQVEELSKEMRAFLDSKNIEGAKEKREELRKVKETLAIEEELYEEEKRILENQAKQPENRIQNKPQEIRAIAKAVLGKNLNDEERELVTVAGNGAVLPEEFIKQIEIYRKGFPSLKKFCHVIPVKTKNGKMPVASLGQNTLAKLTGDAPIPEGAMVTDKISWDVEDFGKFVPIERDLEEDAAVSIIQDVLMPDFGEGSVNAENIEIMSIVKANSEDVEGAKSYEDVEKAIDSTIPGAKANLVTITNTTGYCYLKNLKDKQGRNLNLITKIGDTEYFHGYPIKYLDDKDIHDDTNTHIFYVANLKELVKFFDRKGILIEKSTEFLFNKNQDCIRAIERFDTKKGNNRSAKCIKFKLA